MAPGPVSEVQMDNRAFHYEHGRQAAAVLPPVLTPKSSPVKTPASVFPGVSSTLPRAAGAAARRPLPPPRDEHRLSVASNASAGSGRSSPREQHQWRAAPFASPPPPRTSSKSPMLSPSSPMSPAPEVSSSVPPGGLWATVVGGVLRNSEGPRVVWPGKGAAAAATPQARLVQRRLDRPRRPPPTVRRVAPRPGSCPPTAAVPRVSTPRREGAGHRQQNTSSVPPDAPPEAEAAKT
ncbi:uncharacterized protein [Penaeus vannamei]|uniref:uncharacterized protein n=1 Tax=Penaeus vannamei TaxID=6689 RepID=UPI00387F55DB